MPKNLSGSDGRLTAVATHLANSAAALRLTQATCLASILDLAELIAGSLQNGGKLLLCGNGGSAADCQHMAAELTSRLSANFVRPGLPALALTTDTSFLTACSNDFDFEQVFARQVQALGQIPDVLLGISTSGNSKNVLRAAEMARKLGLKTAALTGADGGRLGPLVDVIVSIPSRNTQHVQEAHLAVEHSICQLVERAVFGEAGMTSWGLDGLP